MFELDRLSIGYSRDKPLLKDLTYKFSSKIYGILGESGVGKTTLLRTIAGLEKPLYGNIVNPQNIPIYMMHQNYTCFDWLTSIDNILISSKVKHEKLSDELKDAAAQSLKRVGLDGYERYLPGELSGGMRQRLALARTMFVKPRIILMDEPLSALDEEMRKEMQNLIVEEHNKTQNTILMITHSTAEAERMCDEIITLKRGDLNGVS